MALLTSLGVPFALAGMFLALHLLGHTLNVSVLLGVAIVLGIPTTRWWWPTPTAAG